MRYDDEIVEIDGRSVHTANQVQNVLATLPAQWRVKLKYRHEGELRSTLVRLASVHGEDELLEKMAAALPPPPPAPDQPKQNEQPDGPEGENGTPDGKDGEPGDAPEKDPHGKPEAEADSEGEKVPQAVLDLYEARRGYANYFVNRQLQKKFMEMLKQQLPFAEAESKAWLIEGKTRAAEPQTVVVEGG